jgi:hypothetical protein
VDNPARNTAQRRKIVKYLMVRNPGLLDVNALKLMGATTKDGINSIGFFGTGNKYAIATLIRTDVPFSIYSGKEQIEIKSKEVIFRDKKFNQILINGEETSITTNMGHTWELWYAIREFISNAKDEGGNFKLIDVKRTAKDETRIFIETEKIQEIIANMSKFFLEESAKQIPSNSTTQVFKQDTTELRIYKQGVRIVPANIDWKLPVALNMDGVELTEDRVWRYSFEVKRNIYDALFQLEDAETFRICLKFLDVRTTDHCPYYEQNKFVIADPVKNFLAEYFIVPIGLYDYDKDVVNAHDLVWVVDNNLAEILHNEGFTVAGFGINGRFNFQEPVAEEFVTDCVLRLAEAGFKIESELKYGKAINGNNILASYLKKPNIIFIDNDYAKACADHEDHAQMCGCLFEEYCHSLGYHDNSRRFEEFLIQNFISLSGIAR